jgi:hypothetical protein
MKIKVLALSSIFTLLIASAARASNIPPDGNVGVRGGTGSTEIFTTNFSFTLTDCTTSNESSDDCEQAEDAFGSFPQGAFAGDNDSGVPIGRLTLTLNFAALTQDESLACDGGTIFTANNCAQQHLDAGDTSATFTFWGGSGIGCFDSNDGEGDSASNAACQAFHSGGGGDFRPLQASSPSPHFVIAVGFGGPNTYFPTLPTQSGGQGSPTPEPSTVALFLTGLGGLVARKRSR